MTGEISMMNISQVAIGVPFSLLGEAA
jgi:hypothetical protein